MKLAHPAVDLAPDPVLPARDTLLDADAVAARLHVDDSTLVRAKYRIGESVRALHRVTVEGSSHLVAGRMFRRGASASAYRKALAGTTPTGGLPPVVHDARIHTVWWTFPNDRRLRGLADVLDPAPDLRMITARGALWHASEVVEVVPERSVTLRALDDAGTTVAFVKVYTPGSVPVDELAMRYDDIAYGLRGAGGAAASPRAVGWSAERHALLLEPMPGVPWTALPGHARPQALRALGRAIATLHGVDLPWLPVFKRLALPRLTRSADLVAIARPDVAEPVTDLARRLAASLPFDDEHVVLHGDCHPKNVLFARDGVALIDLDQAGSGSPAADVGSVLARLGDAAAPDLAAAFLDGYAEVRRLPGDSSLAWHTAAAVLAERAMRAVNRVNRPALARLPELLEVASAALDGDWP